MGGSIALLAQLYTIHDSGNWVAERESNWMDGGTPYYRCYRTADGGFVAVGAIEPGFFANLVTLAGLDGTVDLKRQTDRAYWPELTEHFARAFASRTRAEWTDLAARIDACCTPVLDLDEARTHPQALENGMFAKVGDRIEPAPQPRFSKTPAGSPQSASPQGAEARSILADIGYDDGKIEEAYAGGLVSRPWAE